MTMYKIRTKDRSKAREDDRQEDGLRPWSEAKETLLRWAVWSL